MSLDEIRELWQKYLILHEKSELLFNNNLVKVFNDVDKMPKKKINFSKVRLIAVLGLIGIIAAISAVTGIPFYILDPWIALTYSETLIYLNTKEKSEISEMIDNKSSELADSSLSYLEVFRLKSELASFIFSKLEEHSELEEYNKLIQEYKEEIVTMNHRYICFEPIENNEKVLDKDNLKKVRK